MSIARPAPKPSTLAGPVALRDGVVCLRDRAAFGPLADEPSDRLVRLALALPEVRSVAINRATGTATIRHKPAAGFHARLASAIRGEGVVLPLPPGPALAPEGETDYIARRLGDAATTWDLVHVAEGRVRLRHERLTRDLEFAEELTRRLRELPGVTRVGANAITGSVLIEYRPRLVTLTGLANAAERCLRPEPAAPQLLKPPKPVRLGPANATLGIAMLGELALPALLPVSAMLLIGTNIKIFRAAAAQIRAGQFGLPVLYAVIVGTTLASGQFFASALMSWSLRYWERRLRGDLAEHRHQLLHREQAGFARRFDPTTDREVLIEASLLQVGDRLNVGPAEIIPADGRVDAGEAIVDERSVRGLEGVTRKRAGDRVLDGSTVLTGTLTVEVSRLGDRTHDSGVRRAMLAATTPDRGSTAPTRDAEAFATRAVVPTLATAGFGLLAGDLGVAGAILRPDYATGPGMAVPLETLRDVALCARRGIIVRQPDALARLAEVDLILVDDHPMLARPELEVARITTKMPEDILLPLAAAALRHLDDERAHALMAACRARTLSVFKLNPTHFDRGVTITYGDHQIRVDDQDPAGGPMGPIAVEVDGTLVGLLEFRRSARPEAAEAIRRMQALAPVPMAFLSSRPQDEAVALAAALGIPIAHGDTTPEAAATLIRDAKARGRRIAFVGDCRRSTLAADAAHVAIALLDDRDEDLDAGRAGIFIQGGRPGPLADLWKIAGAHRDRVREAHRLILVPNLFCIAGAFFFGFTSLASVLVSNLGTYGLYRRATDSLRDLDEPATRRALGQFALAPAGDRVPGLS
ncbi:HAD family hydrolase [Isosphaeraceae bacterium EP7]